MKVIQVPFGFYPDPMAGTEVYVEGLSRCLLKCGVQVTVVAPGEKESRQDYQGLPVRHFPVSHGTLDLRDLYGEGDPNAAHGFTRILVEERPDLVHLHAFTSAVSLRLVRLTKQQGIPVVFTYHTPTVSCQRGTLMRWGKEVCDGVLREGLCTRCTLHGLGIPRGVSDLVGTVPASVGSALGAAGLSGGGWTALRMRELVSLRHATFHAFMSEVNHVIAVCEWVRELLLRNGVPASKITLCRQGLADTPPPPSAPAPREGSSPVRLVFLGRFDPTKGIHILIRAIRTVPRLPVSLDIFGVEQGTSGERYLQRLQALAARDPRIRFQGTLPPQEVTRCLQRYDLLAIPSQGLETGPLVVLEAFAAGIPVIGSRRGGIAELVEHEVNGLLVEPASVSAWQSQIRRLCLEKDLVSRLKAGIKPPRTMEAVTVEMERVYKGLTSRASR